MTAISAHAAQIGATERNVSFDTDSGPVGIDNQCTACISHKINDFIPGTLKECKRYIKGYGGARTYNVKQGTIKWTWLDNEGRAHTFKIPKSYYCLLYTSPSPRDS